MMGITFRNVVQRSQNWHDLDEKVGKNFNAKVGKSLAILFYKLKLKLSYSPKVPNRLWLKLNSSHFHFDAKVNKATMYCTHSSL